MTPQVQQLIAACEWFPSQYLVVSQNIYTPFLYYTYLGCALPALFIALFVFVHQRNSLTSRLLLAMNVSLALWVFGSLVLWASEYPGRVMFAWTMVNMVEPFVYFFAFYFAYVFIFKQDFSTEEKLLYTAPLLPTLILAPTPLMLIGFDLTNCDRNAVEGILSIYGYAVEILYVLLIIGFSVVALRAKMVVEAAERRSVVLFTIGITAFLAAFSFGNIIELITANTFIGQYGLLGAPLFSALLAYLIVHYKAFDVKLFSIHAFMTALWLLIFSLLFINTLDHARAVVLVTLAIFTVIAWPLSRSVEREIVGRRENAALATDLQKANDRLQDLDRSKSEFVSIASHQLRTPLTAIRGFAELIRDGSYGPVPAKFFEPLGHIETSVQNMAMSINDFLNVSRIESGTMQYEMGVFSLKELAKTITDELRQYAEKRNIALVFESAPDDELMVYADEGKARQILQNLIDNSIKYTPEGKVVLTASAVSAQHKAVISITDTGIGMSQKTLSIIFDKFVRATNANTANMYGTGLGLYIAKEMAEAMKGHVTAASWGEGHGSTFTIELPLAPQGAAPTAEGAAPVTPKVG